MAASKTRTYVTALTEVLQDRTRKTLIESLSKEISSPFHDIMQIAKKAPVQVKYSINDPLQIIGPERRDTFRRGAKTVLPHSPCHEGMYNRLGTVGSFTALKSQLRILSHEYQAGGDIGDICRP